MRPALTSFTAFIRVVAFGLTAVVFTAAAVPAPAIAVEQAAVAPPDPRWIDYLREKKLLDEIDGQTVAMVDVYFDPSRIEPGVPLGTDFSVLAGEALRAAFPPDSDVDIARLMSPDAREALRKEFARDPSILGTTVRVGVPIVDPSGEERRRP